MPGAKRTITPAIDLCGLHDGLSRIVAERSDDVLDNFTLHWLTNTAASSARIYWENRGRELLNSAAQKTDEASIPSRSRCSRTRCFGPRNRLLQRSGARRALRCRGRTEILRPNSGRRSDRCVNSGSASLADHRLSGARCCSRPTTHDVERILSCNRAQALLLITCTCRREKCHASFEHRR